MSYNMDEVRQAWCDMNRPKSSSGDLAYSSPGGWVKEVWSDFIIVCGYGAGASYSESDMSKVPYKVDSDGDVQFDTPIPVTQKYVELAGSSVKLWEEPATLRLDRLLSHPLALAGSEHVSGYQRISQTTGKTSHIGSYFRSPGLMSNKDIAAEIQSISTAKPSADRIENARLRTRKIALQREQAKREREGTGDVAEPATTSSPQAPVQNKNEAVESAAGKAQITDKMKSIIEKTQARNAEREGKLYTPQVAGGAGIFEPGKGKQHPTKMMSDAQLADHHNAMVKVLTQTKDLEATKKLVAELHTSKAEQDSRAAYKRKLAEDKSPAPSLQDTLHAKFKAKGFTDAEAAKNAKTALEAHAAQRAKEKAGSDAFNAAQDKLHAKDKAKSTDLSTWSDAELEAERISLNKQRHDTGESGSNGGPLAARVKQIIAEQLSRKKA